MRQRRQISKCEDGLLLVEVYHDNIGARACCCFGGYTSHGGGAGGGKDDAYLGYPGVLEGPFQSRPLAGVKLHYPRSYGVGTTPLETLPTEGTRLFGSRKCELSPTYSGDGSGTPLNPQPYRSLDESESALSYSTTPPPLSPPVPERHRLSPPRRGICGRTDANRRREKDPDRYIDANDQGPPGSEGGRNGRGRPKVHGSKTD